MCRYDSRKMRRMINNGAKMPNFDGGSEVLSKSTVCSVFMRRKAYAGRDGRREEMCSTLDWWWF